MWRDAREVAVEGEERRVMLGRDRCNETVDCRGRDPRPTTRVGDPGGSHVVMSLGQDERKRFEERTQADKLFFCAHSRQEFLQHDARDSKRCVG